MVGDIIEAFLAMPQIALSSDSQTEFFQITNHIIFYELPLNRKSFDDIVKLKIPKHITWREKVSSIYPYLDWWEKMNNHLTLFLKLIHLSWQSTYHEEIAPDDILPFLIHLLKKFSRDKLEQLDNNLQHMQCIDSSFGETCYYINKFNMATQFLLMQEQNLIPDDPNNTEDKKIIDFLEVISGKDYYSQLYLVHSILNICSTRLSGLLTDITKCTEQHNFIEYQFNLKEPNLEQRRIDANQTILAMHANLESPPLSEHPELCTLIKKYVTYYEFHNTLSKERGSMFEKLREFVHKYETRRDDLGDDLKTMMFEILEPTQNYLDLPTQRDSWFSLSFFNSASKNCMPLSTFFDSVYAKISRLDNCNDADRANCGF